MIAAARDWLRPPPLRDEPALARFLGQRAAHVSQTVLFGYLKARMGTQHRELFQDPAFAPGIEAAQRAVFLACLEDLVVHTFHMIAAGHPVSRISALAPRVAEAAAQHAETGALPSDSVERLEDRLQRGPGGATLSQAFAHCADVVISTAPVSDSYRAADRDIVDASMRYRWIEVDRQLRDRLDRAALFETLGT